MKFKDLTINQRFEFAAADKFLGMERGPWYKVSARCYMKDTSPFSDDAGERAEHEFWNQHKCEVGSISAEVIAL